MTKLNKFFYYIFILFIIILNSGIWYMPNISGQFLMSQNLTKNPFSNPEADYILTNYLEPFLFGLFQGDTLAGYLLYTLFISVIFLFVFVLWFDKQNYTIQNPYTIFSIITFSVFFIPFYWIGMDGMTLLLMLLIMISLNSKWNILLALLLGLQHFEQGIASFLLLFGSLIASSFISKINTNWSIIKKSIYIILGILTGKLILVLWFMYFSIEPLGNRMEYLEKHMALFANQWDSGWPYILYSFFGIGWILILRNIKAVYPLVLSTIVTFIFIITVGDQTRVGSIILFPSLFYWIFMNKDIINNITLKYTIFALALYLLVPIVYVWGGYPFGALLKYDYQVISEKKTSNNIDFLKPFDRTKKLKFNSIIINGVDLPSKIGNKKGNCRVVFQNSKAGYLTYGPYMKLSEGNYSFDISYNSSENNKTIVCTWDVVIALPHKAIVINKGSLIGTDNRDDHIIQTFIIPNEYVQEKVEIRNYYHGIGSLSIKSLTITKVD